MLLEHRLSDREYSKMTKNLKLLIFATLFLITIILPPTCYLIYYVLLQRTDQNITKMQFMPDMADSPVAKYHRTYIDPPEGSVARNAILYAETSGDAEKIFLNPLLRKTDDLSENIYEGKKIYETFCIVCHGEKGKGDGYIMDKYPPPPDITSKDYFERKDGFFFHVITFGGALMPGYGYATSAKERWQMVLYLRELQKEANQE